MHKKCRFLQCFTSRNCYYYFFQIYSKEKGLEAEQKIKIGEVGYYTLAFPREDSNYEEQFCGYKAVVEINDEKDYILQPNDIEIHFNLKPIPEVEQVTA